VRVHSACTIRQCVVMPDCTIGRGTRLSKVVIDRGCNIPEGLVVGENAELDAGRFFRTSNGVVLITNEMLGTL
jgi:glucose-1-phosphate adenylyltransferase